jgi:CRP/FNR family transcriptional regulator, cyclic AMP receptor protein
MPEVTTAAPYWEELVAIGRRERVPAGRLLFHEGDAGGQLFLIVEGKVRAFSCNDAGRKFIYGTAGPGDVIGEMALDGGPRSADVVAVTSADVVVIERDALREFIRAHPGFAIELIGRIIRRARIAMNSTRNMALLDAYGRLVQNLEAIALPARPDGARECTPIAQMELAARCGCSREMVSRLLNDLARGGYVEISRRRIVLKRKFPERW